MDSGTAPDPADASARAESRHLVARIGGPVAAALLALLTAWVIHDISREVHLDDISAAAAAMPWSRLGISLLLTLVSFAAMGLYDLIAARRVAPGRVPAHMSLLGGAAAYAISNVLGFHVFVGGPVRYRIYASCGLDAADVGRILGLSVSSLWIGVAAIMGGALVVDPGGIPFLGAVPPFIAAASGMLALATLSFLVVWLWGGGRRISVLRWHMPLPGGPTALLLLAIGAVDIAAAAGTLYVLLPPDILPSLPAFVVLFLAAVLLGSVSHVPAGLGVIEATVLIGLGAGGRPDAIAALVLYRAIYYFLPFAVAGLGLLLFEGRGVTTPLARVSRAALAGVHPFVAPVMAGFVFLGGIVLLLSGNLPAEGSRMAILRGLLPLPFAEASHLLASLVGLVLLVLAHGLANRIALARSAAIGFLLAGAAFSLAKGLDWEEALVLAVVALLLVVFRGAFYRRGDRASFRAPPEWLAMVAVTLVSLMLVGFIAYRHVDYRSELWWRFAWSGDAPRFLRAGFAVAVVAAAIAVDALVNRPLQPRRLRQPVPDPVRAVLAECPHTQPQVALLGDKRFLVSPAGNSFLMYGVAGRSWVTMGDPVGDADAGRELVWRLAETADRAGARAVYYGIRPENLPLYVDLGLALLKIGEVARVDLPRFSLQGGARQDLRSALSRSGREGLAFSILPREAVPAAIPELRAVSDAWLAVKKGHEKGFSLGNFDPAYLAEFDCALMRRDGEIVAFANLWRGAGKAEIAVDLMRHRPDVSKVMMDALFARLILHARDEGYRWFNLGAAPLAGLADHPLASTWNRIGTFIYRHGEHFYRFEGLRAFKQKFGPVWTPQYVAAPNGLALPAVLLDVAGLISGGTSASR